jgi:2-oxoglutarate ferredoxin oxidoreductase subunit gamma
MQEEIIISGFGGQGTLFAGQLLAYAAMDSGQHVTWIPSYGPEMRGGKARCTTIISDREIGSPIVRRPSSAIVMNMPSMDAFEPMVKPEGVLVVNSSLIPRRSERTDIRTFHIKASELATELGEVRLANVICLGCLVEARRMVTLDQVVAALDAHLPERHRKLLPLNQQALKMGAEFARA